MEMVQDKMKVEKYEAYKDSGVEWLGEIPEHWGVVKLKYQIQSRTGYAFPSEKYTDEGIPVIRIGDLDSNGLVNFKKCPHLPNDFDKYLDDFGLKRNDLLFAMTGGTIGKVAIFKSTQNALLNQRVCSFTIENPIKRSLIFYWMQSTYWKNYIDLKASGGAQPNISDVDVLNLPIVLSPEIEEQTVIANFLDKKCQQINQAIAQKKRLIELLKERKQILIQNAVTKGLDPTVKMKDSGVDWIGEVPEGWEVVANKVLFQERKEPGEENIPLLSVSIHSAVSSGELSDEENIRGKIKIQDKSNYKLVEVNDITYNMMRAWQGAIGAVRIRGMVSPAYVVARPSNEIDASFFEYQYRTNGFIQQMNRFSKGITDFRKRLYWDEFKQLITIVPPLKVQKTIVDYIEIQSEKIERSTDLQKEQIQKLKEYKSTLINSVVTGKIKVS